MEIHFHKMQGLGNDFVVTDSVNQAIDLNEAQRRLIADRHRGIGCDQILLIEPSDDENHDFIYRIYNADGGEVEQCGNGARCITRYVIEKGLTTNTSLRFKTSTGSLFCEVLANGDIRVDMGVPRFSAASLPFDPQQATANLDQSDISYQINDGKQSIDFAIASMGNPHAVIQTGNVANAPVHQQGALLGQHAAFPKGVNVGFMQLMAGDHIKLRVFERGAGETQACGTGACAAVAVGRRLGLLNDSVNVELPGGTLHIAWSGSDEASLTMSGPAEFVFNGKINL